MSTVHIDADAAITEATRQAITDEDGRVTVHSVLIGAGMMLGADWDLDELVSELRTAREIAWFDDFMDHELAMQSARGLTYKFAVKRPVDVAP